MVAIPADVKKMITEQKVIILGTADEKGLPNISPRSTFHLEDDKIYWHELFEHKSFTNFMANQWVSIAVFDKEELTGYQLKGKVSIIKDKEKRNHVDVIIKDRLTRQSKKNVLQLLEDNEYQLIEFSTIVVYSLSPKLFSDVPNVLDADLEIGRLVGGSKMKSTFGLDENNFD